MSFLERLFRRAEAPQTRTSNDKEEARTDMTTAKDIISSSRTTT